MVKYFLKYNFCLFIYNFSKRFGCTEMNSFIRQGKALPVEVRNIIVGKWLHNEGIASIANIIQYVIQYLVRYFNTLVQYFSTLVGYFST